MPIPVIDGPTVLDMVTSATAIEQVRRGFIRHFRGEWTMPSKVYLDSPPFGDFRAMPALGDGTALLKWVTSFPGNPAKGLPTVTGTILLSDAVTGELLAIIDGRSVTALRTGAAAAVATLALVRPEASTAGLIGCGLHGGWAARCLVAAGFTEGVCSDTNEDASRSLAEEVGWRAGTSREVLACDSVTLVTPGYQPVLGEADLRGGMHINALGADGPQKLEMEVAATARCRIFCDEWFQAAHGGEIHAAVEQGLVTRDRVTELGSVLAGESGGRRSPDEITLFDSTGLAIQDLAVALAVLEAAEEPTTTIEL
jgi:alanine dehydrogenase